MDVQNSSKDIETELKNKQKHIISILEKVHHNQSKNSAKNVKSNLSISKFDKSLIGNIFDPSKLNRYQTNEFVPKECNIKCSDFEGTVFSSEEEEEEDMGKGLKSIGKEIKQKIIGMGVGIKIKKNRKSFSKNLNRRSLKNPNLTTIKILMNNIKKKNKNKEIGKKSEIIQKQFKIFTKNEEKQKFLQKIKNII